MSHRKSRPANLGRQVHFARMMNGSPLAKSSGQSGNQLAGRMLGPEGWSPGADEAVACGLATAAVPPSELLSAAQRLAEAWVEAAAVPGAKRPLERQVPQPDDSAATAAETLAEYRAVNDSESRELARAFLGPDFLAGQVAFLGSKGKAPAAAVFRVLLALRPLWSRFLNPDADILRHSK